MIGCAKCTAPTDALDDMAYVMACVECGEGRAWPDFLCETCRLEPPTDEACPERRGVGHG